MMGTALLHNRVIKTGVKVAKVLNDNSWETISKVAAEAQAQNYWAVGDTKEIIINGNVGVTTFSNLSLWAFILGFNHNSKIEGSNTIHFQMGKSTQSGGRNLGLVDSNYNAGYVTSAGYVSMNYSYTNSGGWKSSKMRTALLGNNNTPASPLSGSLMAALPNDLLAVMKGVNKYSDNTGGNNTASNVTATTDYLWLLSEYEVYGARTNANSAEKNYQKQYTYYANGNSKAFYKYNSTSFAIAVWLRSTNSKNTNGFCRVGAATGNACSPAGANYCYGMAPAFCV